MKLAYFLPLVAAILCASCDVTSRPTPRPNIPVPESKPPISESAGRVRSAADEAGEGQRSIENQVQSLRRSTTEALGEAARAKREVSRLVAQKQASEQELLNLQEIFAGLESRNMFLEMDVDLLDTKVKSQAVTIKTLREEVSRLEIEAAQKDSEVFEKDKTIKALQDENQTIVALNEDLAKAAQKAEIKKAGNAAYKWIFYIVLGLICIAFVIKLLLKSANPIP